MANCYKRAVLPPVSIRHRALLRRVLFGGSLLALSLTAVSAQTLTWDGGMTSSPAGGTGTWDAGTTADWYNGAADTIWANGDNAVFGGTAGTVTIASGGVTANSLLFSTTGYVVTGGALTLSGSSLVTTNTGLTATISSPIAGTAGLTTAGTGTLVLNGTNTFSGALAINAGTLQFGDGTSNLGTFGGGNVTSITVAAGATYAVNYLSATNSQGASGDGTSNTAITGAGNVTFLGEANGYYGFAANRNPLQITGTTTVNLSAPSAATFDGSIYLYGASVLSPNSVLNLVSGLVINRSGAQTIAGLTNTGTSASGKTGYFTDDQGTTYALTINTAAGTSYTYGGVIGSATSINASTNTNEALTKTGLGTQILTGTNSYAGATTVSQGTLQLGDGTVNGGALSGTSSITVASGATFAVDYNAVTTGSGTPLSLPIAGAGNYSLLGNQGGFYSVGSSGGGPASLAITGTTNVNLIPNSTGPYYGSLFVQSANVLSPNSVLNIISGNVDLRGNQTVLGLTNTGTPITGTTNTGGFITTDGTRSGTGLPILTVTPASGTTYTYGGQIGLPATIGGVSGAGADTYHSTTVGLTMNGAGTQILSGISNYSGPTTITQGTLQYGNGTTGSINGLTSAISVASGANLIIDDNTQEALNAAISGAGNVTIEGYGSGYLGINTRDDQHGHDHGGAWYGCHERPGRTVRQRSQLLAEFCVERLVWQNRPSGQPDGGGVDRHGRVHHGGSRLDRLYVQRGSGCGAVVHLQWRDWIADSGQRVQHAGRFAGRERSGHSNSFRPQ